MTLARRVLNSAVMAVLAGRERGVPFWSEERIARRQARRVRAIVQHAYETVPYYAQSMRELRLTPRDLRTADDLSALPLIEPAVLRADPDRFLSSSPRAAQRRSLSTAGSHGGHRGSVAWDEASLLRKLAYLERDRAVIGRLLGRASGHRQMFLLPAGSQSFMMRRWWDEWTLTPRRVVRRDSLPADVPYQEAADRIAATRPDVIYTYGSYAEHFARWLAAKGLRLTAPRVWCYGGDGMSPGARALLEQQTGTMVYTTYQATETGRIGFECERRDGLHLNVDLCALRVADADGRTVSPGSEGEVIVSNLHNQATVLLNYRLGDRGALATAPCPCGRGLPVLRALLGRHTDVVRLADGREISALVLETVCNVALMGTLRSQLVCVAPGRVTWRVVLAPGVDRAAMHGAVDAVVRASFGDALRVTLEPVAEILSTPQGKFRRVLHGGAADAPLAGAR